MGHVVFETDSDDINSQSKISILIWSSQINIKFIYKLNFRSKTHTPKKFSLFTSSFIPRFCKIMALSKPKIDKIDIVYHPRFQHLKCYMDGCEKVAEFKTFEDFAEHCHEGHGDGSSLRDILGFPCLSIEKKGVCRATFKDAQDLFTHRGIRHYDTAAFYCSKCHWGKLFHTNITQINKKINFRFISDVQNLKISFPVFVYSTKRCGW